MRWRREGREGRTPTCLLVQHSSPHYGLVGCPRLTDCERLEVSQLSQVNTTNTTKTQRNRRWTGEAQCDN